MDGMEDTLGKMGTDGSEQESYESEDGPTEEPHHEEEDALGKNLTQKDASGTNSTKMKEAKHVTQCSSDVKLPPDMDYKMNNPHRGRFVIFCHETYDKLEDCNGEWITPSDRKGARDHAKMLEDAVKGLEFECETYHDLTKKELFERVHEYAGMDYIEYDCFGCAILTHGQHNDILCAKDSIYHLKGVMRAFCCCETLIGKPKLFFIQACKGDKRDRGQDFRKEDAMGSNAADWDNGQEDATPEKNSFLPLESDFLIGYATPEGYKAHRGWYIPTLARCLTEYQHLELTQILTIVNREVATYVVPMKLRDGTINKKQAPGFMSRLTKMVNFTQKESRSDMQVTEDGMAKEEESSSNEDDYDLLEKMVAKLRKKTKKKKK